MMGKRCIFGSSTWHTVRYSYLISTSAIPQHNASFCVDLGLPVVSFTAVADSLVSDVLTAARSGASMRRKSNCRSLESFFVKLSVWLFMEWGPTASWRWGRNDFVYLVKAGLWMKQSERSCFAGWLVTKKNVSFWTLPHS